MCVVVIESLTSAVYGIRLRWHASRRTGSMDAVPSGAVVNVDPPVNARVDIGETIPDDDPADGSAKTRVNARL